MSDQEPINKSNNDYHQSTTHADDDPSTLDPTKNSKCDLKDFEDHSETIRAPHIPGGHTFLVTTITTETITSEQHIKKSELTAVPVFNPTTNETTIQQKQSPETSKQYEKASSSKAIVPLSTSLPSKLLRYHAKLSAQALLHQIEHQAQSLDSQFSSDEGSADITTSDDVTNDCADIFDIQSPTAPPMSPVPHLPPLVSPHDSGEERLIDVGMGSSIEGSEESEEDDELKPLAVDNHVLHNVELGSPISEQQLVAAGTGPTTSTTTSLPSSSSHEYGSTSPPVLSEANLEKFRKHHHHNMDNIYLHPNFKHDYVETNGEKDVYEYSPPPAVAPANSPVEQRRVHRSFLTMKKSGTAEVDNEATIGGATIHPTTTTSTNTDPSDIEQASVINEVDTLDPALIPNDELSAEITEAVEFYFSNDSILKDAFLLKHVRRNKEGFVSLKLVSSFKRVRQLTKDWRVVGYAVRRMSRKIELNDVGTKMRRLEPLPSFDETMPSRTIVACDLPLDKLCIEKVSDLFSKCGEIALIRILKPGMAIPVDVRQFMNKYPEMTQKECALVEYLESSSAREAKNLQGPFQVFEMVAPKKKTGKKAIIQVAAPVARMVENYRYYNDATYERTRGGSFSGVTQQDVSDLRYKLKRNNSDFHPRSYVSDVHHQNQYNQLHHQHQHQQQPQHYHNNNSNHHYQSHHRGSFGEHTHPFQHYHPRGSTSHDVTSEQTQTQTGNGNFFAYSPRRYSNTSTISANTAAALGDSPTSTTQTAPTTQQISNNNNNNNNSGNSGSYAHVTGQNPTRRLSNSSDTYSSFSEMSRRPSNCSEHMPQRRDSNCSENCPCSRRVSDFGQTESYRKNSQCSIGSNSGERRFSNGSLQFERTFSNSSDGFPRRMSNDFNYERKQSIEPQTNYDDPNVGGGGGGYIVFPRRYSNNFNTSSKLAAYDNAQYINGRRISTDSGYDRRYSFGSEYEGSPRSRTGSFINNYKHGVDIDGQPRSRTNSFLDGSPRSRSGSLAQRNAESLVRTPIGPDGSKGFGSRARKFGQTVSPVN